MENDFWSLLEKQSLHAGSITDVGDSKRDLANVFRMRQLLAQREEFGLCPVDTHQFGRAALEDLAAELRSNRSGSPSHHDPTAKNSRTNVLEVDL
jgi:hypothetical protein